MKNQIKIDLEVVKIVSENLKSQLQTIRDLKAHNKSTIKEKLAKLERHVALSSQMSEELIKKLVDKLK